jgi:predicted outer membrane repeat protein
VIRAVVARTLAVLLVTAAWSPRPVRADAVVGTGTASSCAEGAFDTALAGGGTITFNCGPNPVTITVTSTKIISADTTIDGGNLITISGGNSVGVFSVNPGVNFTVQNLTITNGNAGEFGNGGGIYSADGTVTVTNSIFSGNSAPASPGSGNGNGGGIASYGALTVTNSTFSGNSAGVGGGGIDNGGTLTVTNSTFSGNSAYYHGGGIESGGGALTVTNSTFSGNSAAVEDGGGIFIGYSTGTVANSIFSGNSAGGGGGISVYNAGTLTVANSTFFNNSAPGAGGGGIANDGMLTVANSTFSGNGATNGGGIYSWGGTLPVTNCTFSGNSATNGGGIYYSSNGKGAATVTNTILANSSGGNCAGDPVTNGGYNIDDGTTCYFSGTGCTSTAGNSFCNTNPQLYPAGLANNGGPTQTIALQAGSRAINAGNEIICAAPPINNLDQRGFGRPGTGATNCSIGAYEYNSPGPPSCCQCPASCAAPINGSCGDCIPIDGASCASGELCVLYTPTPSPTPTSITPSPNLTPSRTPTQTPTNTPGSNDCCQCASFCAAPIEGTCGGCAVVFGASCTAGGLCSRSGVCVGDCNGDHQVTVDDILTMVNIALGNTPVTACEAGDANGDGQITVDEILTAVDNALNGCSVP